MFRRVLVLAPHADDGEMGCGGTIAKLIEEKKDVYYAAFSMAEDSIPHGFASNQLEIEVKKATKILGIPERNLIIRNFKVRKFPEFRQEILEELVKINKEFDPDLIFMPSPNDMHQDHQVIANEGVRAFKRKTILGYEEPWNNIVFHTTAFSVLQEHHLQKKMDALACYESQRHRAYLTPQFLKSLSIARGTQIQEKYAESFEVIRYILK